MVRFFVINGKPDMGNDPFTKENVIRRRRRFRIHTLLYFVFEDCQAKRYDIATDGDNLR
jgi:hypothetical protein